MFITEIKTDNTLQELTKHGTIHFPIQVYTDYFDRFVLGYMNWHWHNEIEFGVVISGEVDYYINKSHYHLSKNDCVFVNSNSLHMATIRGDIKDCVMFSIVFQPSFLCDDVLSPIYINYIKPVVSNNFFSGMKLSNDVLWQRIIISKLKKLYILEGEKTFAYEFSYKILMCEVWQKLILNNRDCFLEENKKSRYTIYEQRAKKMLGYIYENYTGNITVDDIAAAAKIGRSECFRCFNKIIHKKPFEYLNEYRLEIAAALLINSDKSVSEICFSCGFNNSSYFGKIFKEKFRMTPLKYRSLNKLNKYEWNI